MEEKKPLESKLTHTSKEPEAQVWAQIGTKSYDPPVQSNDKIAKKEEPPAKENGEGAQAVESTETPEVMDVGTTESEKPNEEEKTEDAEQKEEPKAKELPKSKSFTVGDGFVEPSTNSEEKSGDDDAKGGDKRDSRSRTRSRSRERKRSPGSKYNDYTTNSSDPRDVRSRVFIGHLSTDNCTKQEVDDLFQPFGKVLGINLQNGYGFVQYENEKSVKEAIKHLHATVFHGDKLGMHT
jgi:RNA recognition motif-containing protein